MPESSDALPSSAYNIDPPPHLTPPTHTCRSERAAVLTSTFIAQFINTCVILVAVELDWVSIVGFNFWDYLPGFSEHTSDHHDPQDLIDVSNQSHFGVEWYQVVGSSILLNLLVNSIVPHVVLAVTSR